MRNLTIADVPGFADAWEAAESELEEAMILPYASSREMQCGEITYNQLTLQMLADLDIAGSVVFSSGGSDDPADYGLIGYRMWARYDGQNATEYQNLFVAEMDLQVAFIRRYLVALSKIPSRKIGNKKDANPNKVSYYGYIVNTFASIYGWSYRDIMDTPVAITHQLINAARERNEQDFRPEPRHRELKRRAMVELRKMKGEQT